MRALMFDGTPKMADAPMPEPGEGEALIRVLTAGICNTDIEILRGYMAFRGILGHEFVGVVEHCETPKLRGRRVVGEINCVCHRCAACRAEMPRHCYNRSVLGIANRHGAFAEYVTLPEENLHLVPSSVRDDVAVFAEPVAAAFRILEQVPVLRDDRVIVLGDGKLGQLAAQAVSTRTNRVLCVGRHAWKLALLAARHIATAGVDEPVESGADIVIEATGSAEGLARALELVRPEGVIALKTTIHGTAPFDISRAVVNEIRIVGSRCGSFPPALEALAQGQVEVRPLISETYGIEEGVQALERAQAPDVMKVLLRVGA